MRLSQEEGNLVCGVNCNKRRLFLFPVEVRSHFCEKFNRAVFTGVERVVFGAQHIGSRNVFRATLANDNLTNKNFLAILKLHAQTL